MSQASAFIWEEIRRNGSYFLRGTKGYWPLSSNRTHFRFPLLKTRLSLVVLLLAALLAGAALAQEEMPAADSGSLDFKQWGLLAIQDGGRRKPLDTFAREALIKITGRSSYTAPNGKKWKANDFVLSALLETHDWKNGADGAGLARQLDRAARTR